MASADQTVLQFVPLTTSLSAKVHPLVIFNISTSVIVSCGGLTKPSESSVLYSAPSFLMAPLIFAIPTPFHTMSPPIRLRWTLITIIICYPPTVNPKEVIVGWFSTGFGVTGGSALIHDFYSREVTNPIHLTVDTGFTNATASIKAFVSVSLSLGDQQLAAQFQEVPLDLCMVEAERVGYDILKSTAVDKLPTDLEGMETSMERLLALIDDIYKYVDDVVEGRVAPDNNIGRFISESVASVPKLSPPVFDKLVNDSLQDQLLLLYLSSITRTQLSLAEKLNTAAQIL